MTIKSRISLWISLVFTVLYGITSIILIISFAEFRVEEFKERLEQKALTTIKLLVSVKEVDDNLLQIIDKNSVPQLYEEHITIFDAQKKIIYSTHQKENKLQWSQADLSNLVSQNSIYKKDLEIETLGVSNIIDGKKYYAFISATDKYGTRKQQFLSSSLLVVWVLFSIATWLLTFFVVKRQLVPLDYFLKKIATINEKNLDSSLSVQPDSNNEIDRLSIEFNYMLKRLNDGYLKQKEFTSNASHELRTPLTRISAQLENHLPHASAVSKSILLSVLSDVRVINELIRSLLLLSKLDNLTLENSKPTRVDEVLYYSIEKVSMQYQDIKVTFNIDETLDELDVLEVNANQSLLEIAFINLLRNAYEYGDTKILDINIYSSKGKMHLSIQNDGETISESDQKNLFAPFMRGLNSRNKHGLGLGLRIVERILNAYKFTVKYQINNHKNEFLVTF